MAKKLGFFKRLKLYFHYRKLLKNNEDILNTPKYNLRKDYVNRIYTVVNLPPDVKTYGTELAQKYVSEYISDVDKLFAQIGISEYVGILDIKQESEMDYVVVFGFKFIDTAKLANRILITLIATPIIWTLLLLIF